MANSEGSKGSGKGKNSKAPPPPPVQHISGELLRLTLSTLTGSSVDIEVSRTQTVVDVLRGAAEGLGLSWHRGGVYAILIGDLKLSEGRDGQNKPMYLFPSLFEVGEITGVIIRQSHTLSPGQQVKVVFNLVKELQNEHHITRLHGQEGFVCGWMESSSAWLLKMYGSFAGADTFWLVEGRHLALRNIPTNTWVTPDLQDGDESTRVSHAVDLDNTLNVSRLIDEGLALAAEERTRSSEVFDGRRRTVEWAMAQAYERELRLGNLVVDTDDDGVICVGSHKRTEKVVDASWDLNEHVNSEFCHGHYNVAAIAFDLAPRILPLRFGRIM